MRDLRLTDAHPCSKLQQQKISWRGLTEILPLLTFHMVPIQFGSFCYKHVDSASGSKQAHMKRKTFCLLKSMGCIRIDKRYIRYLGVSICSTQTCLQRNCKFHMWGLPALDSPPTRMHCKGGGGQLVTLNNSN